jgi:hypothetical protein
MGCCACQWQERTEEKKGAKKKDPDQSANESADKSPDQSADESADKRPDQSSDASADKSPDKSADDGADDASNDSSSYGATDDCTSEKDVDTLWIRGFCPALLQDMEKCQG